MSDRKNQNPTVNLDHFLFELCAKHPQQRSFKAYLKTLANQKVSAELTKDKWTQTVAIHDQAQIQTYNKQLEITRSPQDFIKFLLKQIHKSPQSTSAFLIVQDYFLLPLPKEECFHWLKYTHKLLSEASFYLISKPLIATIKANMSDLDYSQYIKSYFQNKYLSEYIPWLFLSLPKAIMAKPQARFITKQINLLNNSDSTKWSEAQQAKIFYILLLEKFSLSEKRLFNQDQIDTFTNYYLDLNLGLHYEDFLNELKKWDTQSDALFSLASETNNTDLYLFEFILDQVLLVLPTDLEQGSNTKKHAPVSDKDQQNVSIRDIWLNWKKDPRLNKNFLVLQNQCITNQLSFYDFMSSISENLDPELKASLLAFKNIVNYQYVIYFEGKSKTQEI